MKRLLCFLLAALLLALPPGCGEDEEPRVTSPVRPVEADEGATSGDRGERRDASGPGESGENESPSSRSANPAPPSGAEVARDEDVERAVDSVSSFYEILGEDSGGRDRTTVDSAAFCELMSEEAQRQTVEYAKRSSGLKADLDCEAAVNLLVLRSKRSGGFAQNREAEVIGVNVAGDRATATVRFGNAPATSIALVREDGEWKLAAAPPTG
ncbi:MAG TPA: hypothetical protein VEQ41_01400 [Solirubrobacterales bacterium]|nr:hypothetical protein [Solirubrobacterales bacterium]